jgi:major membrane immunogen (membrane-anchored lipoprotein)
MKKETLIKTLSISLLTATLLVGCGGSSSTNDNASSGSGMENNENNDDTGGKGSGSNISYLRDNHANYKEHGSNLTPAPVKDANAKSINWTIAATTEESAIKLQDHLAFMEERLLNNQNPRAWDKLFLMEAYMKYNRYYTTSVERSGTNVVVSKNANTSCAYEVISAHSDAVSGDFFSKGDITIDYSSTAESILASSACDAQRTSIESYISSRKMGRGR